MKEEIVLIGGGGHCKACVDVIEAENRFKIAGIIDTEEKLHQRILDYEVIACDSDLPKLVKSYKYFLITIGCVKNPYSRVEKFEYLKQLGAECPVIVSPLAYVAKSACIGEGTIVMHKACVNTKASIGRNCIVNTAALVEHDTKINEHCHISTGSIINGECNIGNRVFVGSNSVVVNNININDDAVIGAGSVVIESIGKAGTYLGIPAQRVNKGDESLR